MKKVSITKEFELSPLFTLDELCKQVGGDFEQSHNYGSFGIGEDEEIPCYLSMFNGTDCSEISPNLIPLVIEGAIRQAGKEAIVLFSVTTKESNYMLWLDELKKFNDVQIQTTVREMGRSAKKDAPKTYTCYFVSIPAASNQ